MEKCAWKIKSRRAWSVGSVFGTFQVSNSSLLILNPFCNLDTFIHSYKEVWPLSLLALRSAVGNMSLERQPCEHKRFILPSGFSTECTHIEFLKDDDDESFALDSKLYSKHIKPKKLHEIEIMAKVIFLLENKQNYKHLFYAIIIGC